MLDDATDVDDCLPDEVIAFHEAGHAAVDYYFGHDIERVSIERDGDAAGGVLIDRSGDDALGYEDELRKQVPFERRIMAAMAGEIAQRRFAPNSVDDIHGGEDRRVIHDYLDRLDCSTQEIREAWWRLLKLRTEELVSRNWPSIERIAARLLSQRVLSGAEVEEAFKDPLLAKWGSSR